MLVSGRAMHIGLAEPTDNGHSDTFKVIVVMNEANVWPQPFLSSSSLSNPTGAVPMGYYELQFGTTKPNVGYTVVSLLIELNL